MPWLWKHGRRADVEQTVVWVETIVSSFESTLAFTGLKWRQTCRWLSATYSLDEDAVALWCPTFTGRPDTARQQRHFDHAELVLADSGQGLQVLTSALDRTSSSDQDPDFLCICAGLALWATHVVESKPATFPDPLVRFSTALFRTVNHLPARIGPAHRLVLKLLTSLPAAIARKVVDATGVEMYKVLDATAAAVEASAAEDTDGSAIERASILVGLCKSICDIKEAFGRHRCAAVRLSSSEGTIRRADVRFIRPVTFTANLLHFVKVPTLPSVVGCGTVQLLLSVHRRAAGLWNLSDEEVFRMAEALLSWSAKSPNPSRPLMFGLLRIRDLTEPQRSPRNRTHGFPLAVSAHCPLRGTTRRRPVPLP